MQDQNQDQELEAPVGGGPARLPTNDLAAPAELHTGGIVTLVKEPGRLLRPARILVILSLGYVAVNVGFDAFALLTPGVQESGFFKSDAHAAAAAEDTDRWRPVGFREIGGVILLLSIVFSMRWIYFSGKNVRALGATGLAISPGWAVGWSFIPIANLWKPYQAMKEIWQASRDPLDWERQRPSPLLAIWWSLWLVLVVASQSEIKLTSDGRTFPGIGLSIMADIVINGIIIALCAVFVMLMNEIKRLQIEAMEYRNILSVFSS